MKQPTINPKTKDVLLLLATGTLLVTSIVMPGVGVIAKEILKEYQRRQREQDIKEWQKYNPWRLRQLIARMQESKYIKVIEENDTPIVKITQKGKNRLLKYDLENLKLDESNWDGRWHLVIYDIPKMKKSQSELFRETLKRLNMLKLQKSVYLTPFKCEDEIEYLRQLFGIGDEVQILIVDKLENEVAYRNYFGL